MAKVCDGVLGLHEAVRLVACGFALGTGNLKSRVAHPPANVGGTRRHDAAWVLRLELSRMALGRREMKQWAA